MTIAIGIMVEGGLVLAADTQETLGYGVKLATPKILTTVNDLPDAPAGALVASGAGSSDFLDALIQEISESFSARQHDRLSAAEADIKERVAAFSERHLSRYVGLPEYERPACSLILGAGISGVCRLWTTDKSVVRQVQYCAVGVGAPYANLLLSRLVESKDSTEDACVIAAYVLFWVKRSIEGCGNYTHIVIVEKDQVYMYHPRKLDHLEKQFARFVDIEDRLLRYLLSGKGRGIEGISRSLADCRRSILRASSLPTGRVTKKLMRQAPWHRWFHDGHPRMPKA